MHDERIDELLPSYALGALDGDDLAEVEAHVAGGCARCVQELAAWGDTVSQLHLLAPAAVPPAGLRDRVLGVAAADAAPPAATSLADARRRRAERAPAGPRAAGAFAAAAVLIVASAVAIIYLAASLRAASEELGVQIQRVAALTDHPDAQDRQLADRERQLDVVRDPYLRVTRLAPEAAGASAEVLWSPTHKRGLMIARGLARVSADKTYELWLIAGGTPVPAGTFNADEAGNAVLELPEIRQGAGPDAFGVTLEPAGGSKTPTAPILLQGKYPTG